MLLVVMEAQQSSVGSDDDADDDADDGACTF
jgi:hypothetical protein